MILFEKLLANVAKKPKFVHFEDKGVEEICLNAFDKDKDRRLSIEEAASVKNVLVIREALRKRASNSFDEFKYFTGVERLGVSCFGECNLTAITLPYGIKKIGQYAFLGNRISKLIIPETCIEVAGNVLEKNTVDCDIIFLSPTPPKTINVFLMNRYTRVKSTVYVPDESVDAYRAQGGFVGYENQVRPMSELHK